MKVTYDICWVINEQCIGVCVGDFVDEQNTIINPLCPATLEVMWLIYMNGSVAEAINWDSCIGWVENGGEAGIG